MLVLLSFSPLGPAQQLADGPGREEMMRLCKGCHEVARSVSVRQDRAGWQTTMNKMVGFGMKATDEEVTVILDYLFKNYPAEDVPPVNGNKARAIELESGLSLRRSQATALIAFREKNGPFKSMDELKKVPGLDPEHLEERKDRIVF